MRTLGKSIAEIVDIAAWWMSLILSNLVKNLGKSI